MRVCARADCGMHLAIKQPARAVDEVVSRMDGASRDLEVERLQTLISDILTGEVRRNGIGGVDPARLDRSIAEVAEDFELGQMAHPRRIFSTTASCRHWMAASSIEQNIARGLYLRGVPNTRMELLMAVRPAILFASPGMSMFRLYVRVLQLLGKEARLGWILAAANLLLAGAQFAEPVLFGRIVDVLSGKPSAAFFRLAAAGSLGGIRPVHHLQAAPGSRCTPTG